MNLTYRKITTKTLDGRDIVVNHPRFIKLRIVAADIRLWLARKIVPYGWTVMDEAGVSHYEYLKEPKAYD